MGRAHRVSHKNPVDLGLYARGVTGNSSLHGAIRAREEITVDPESVVREMQAFLEDSVLEPSLHYPISVLLLAREVQTSLHGSSMPPRVQELVTELIVEIQRWTTTEVAGPRLLRPESLR